MIGIHVTTKVHAIEVGDIISGWGEVVAIEKGWTTRPGPRGYDFARVRIKNEYGALLPSNEGWFEWPLNAAMSVLRKDSTIYRRTVVYEGTLAQLNGYSGGLFGYNAGTKVSDETAPA